MAPPGPFILLNLDNDVVTSRLDSGLALLPEMSQLKLACAYLGV